MKIIENKTVSLEGPGLNGQKLIKEETYIGLINECLMFIPQGGIDYAEIKKRDRIYDKVQDHSVTTIELEDTDYSHLIVLVTNMRWGVSCKGIKQFCEDILDNKK